MPARRACLASAASRSNSAVSARGRGTGRRAISAVVTCVVTCSADQVVGHQAVHQTEQAPLRRRVERRLQAEHRMRRDRAARQHRGDQRQLVGRACDIAVGNAIAIEGRRAVEQPRCRGDRNSRMPSVRDRRETARAACPRPPAGPTGVCRRGERSAGDRRWRSVPVRSGRASRPIAECGHPFARSSRSGTAPSGSRCRGSSGDRDSRPRGARGRSQAAAGSGLPGRAPVDRSGRTAKRKRRRCNRHWSSTAPRSACCGESERCAPGCRSPARCRSPSHRTGACAATRCRDRWRCRRGGSSPTRPPGLVRLQRPFDEQLVAVGMPIALMAVGPGRAAESQNAPSSSIAGRAVGRRAAVGAQHVPRWIADHGIEARGGARVTGRIEEHFWKRELPVEHRMARRDRARLAERCPQPRGPAASSWLRSTQRSIR